MKSFTLVTLSSVLLAGVVRDVGAQASELARIDTMPPRTVLELPFEFQSGTFVLPGTLTLPANYTTQIPVALIVAGSGPTDRNGNAVGPLRAQSNSNLYAILAWQLAEAGIASVRYDKRIIGDNLRKVDAATISIDDFVADAIAGARKLVADRRFSKVIFIGHSEGAGLVLQAANRGAPVAGIVTLSGAGRPIGPVLREQLSRQLPSEEIVKWDSAFARYLRGEPPGDVNPALSSLLAPINRRFMQTWVQYDPAAEIARVKVPVLIVQGGLDIQVSVEDARALKAAHPTATLVVIPAANHVYRTAVSTDRMAQLKLYTDPTLPVVSELSPAIANWIKGLK
jgi:pimeloyl-ACP methyl ester carboxylesterase